MADSPDSSGLQRTTSGSVGPPVVVKVESGVSSLSPTHTSELYFLRSRVRELEREKAELSAENQRLKTMLVHEIPGLLSTMWQTLGQANSHHSIPAPTSRSDNYPLYLHQQHSTNQDVELRPQVNSQQLQEDLSGDIFESWGPLGSEDEEMPGDLGLGSNMGEEAPLCSQTNMEELRRSCSESQCTAGNINGHVSQVEVYPGSGVLCDIRSWQAANQAQSPTAMARTLLMGVFDMNTLMNSNLRGGRSRRPAFQPQRSALDPHKINAIFNAILARFPLAKKGVIGSGINSKLSEIRFRSRRANRDPRFL
ncbi:uncharacterized protein [Takifugu rubripes]|uniref:BEN domain-containing protein n=2 Tax=Takifugu TaxID=31032 RepID=A0A5C6PHY2_9TELE|nr:uncharacterized protein LOC105416350 [Takifugu rubripes]XP_056903042.1 uncharacterized protein LOC130533549 [Takifugu flavidus]TNM99389.1 hypothetical protein fugu_012422 [Takifugu bimaculatus]TWW78506.1 hypothetical protein D4764_11G0006270 [Takifugu flavidus]|eukprot:XP_011601500.1 PREDICTED: uncharacterized protein LOC105416350 [Takifugu rubripes]